MRISRSGAGWLVAVGALAFMTPAVARADGYSPPELPWANCSGDIGANSTVIEARALPEEGASVVAGTQVTFSTSSVAPVTFSVASSPAQLANPDVDQGLAQPLPAEGIHMQGFTSSKAASTPGTVYWQASFSAAEVPGCAGVLSGLITGPVRKLTVLPQPSPLPTTVISATTTTSAPAVTGSVSLDGSTLSVQRSGETAVKLACIGTGTCDGELRLSAKTEDKDRRRHAKTMTIGTTTFSIPPGKTATLELELNSIGHALLGADHGRLSGSLAILETSPSPLRQTENVGLYSRRLIGT